MLQATSGLGAAAAYALSKEGFYIILGILLLFLCLYKEACFERNKMSQGEWRYNRGYWN